MGVFEITSLTLGKTQMQGRMLVHSPLPFNLTADSLHYTIYIRDMEVVKSTYVKSLSIKKWDST